VLFTAAVPASAAPIPLPPADDIRSEKLNPPPLSNCRPVMSAICDFPPPIVFMPVLTYRRVYASDYSISLATSQEGKVFSNADIPIPSNLLGVVDTAGVTNTLALRERFGFAWLKSCSFDILSDGSQELVETYTFGSYPLHYYSGTWQQQNPF